MITITNKNVYRSEFSLSSLYSLDKVKILSMDDITLYLSDNVELGESVTFKRLFEIVSVNLLKFNEIFYSSLGGYPLEPYLQEIENNPTESIESDYLEINWFCDKYENELNINPSLHGIAIKESESYALDFTALNNLKNCNVKINKTVEYYDYKRVDGRITDSILINLGEKAFTLFELFNAIFYEISYHGGPQDKKERFSEIEESMEEVKDNLDDLKESSDKFTTFEEMIEKFDAKDKYLVKYNELRDRVEKKRVSNKKNLPKLKNCLLEKLKIYDQIEKSDIDNLIIYYKKLTDIEFNMQLLYGEEEDISYHRFWETPKCTCPKIDNLEIFPFNNPIFDSNCPIHKK